MNLAYVGSGSEWRHRVFEGFAWPATGGFRALEARLRRAGDRHVATSTALLRLAEGDGPPAGGTRPYPNVIDGVATSPGGIRMEPLPGAADLARVGRHLGNCLADSVWEAARGQGMTVAFRPAEAPTSVASYAIAEDAEPRVVLNQHEGPRRGEPPTGDAEAGLSLVGPTSRRALRAARDAEKAVITFREEALRDPARAPALRRHAALALARIATGGPHVGTQAPARPDGGGTRHGPRHPEGNRSRQP